MTSSAGLARVRVLSRHSVPGSDPDTSQTSVMGRYSRKTEGLYISYREPSDSGLGQTSTTIRIASDEFRIIRFGDVRATQRFVPDQQTYSCVYETAQGTLPMDIRTNVLAVDFPPSGVWVRVQADLQFAGQDIALDLSLEVELL